MQPVRLGKVTVTGTLVRSSPAMAILEKRHQVIDHRQSRNPPTSWRTLVSEILGDIGKLNITSDVRGAAVMVEGKLAKVTFGGDLVGDTGNGAALIAILARSGSIVAAAGTGGIPVGAFTAGSVGSFKVEGDMNGGSVGADGDIGKVNVGNDSTGGAIAAGGQIEVVKVFGKLTSDDPNDPLWWRRWQRPVQPKLQGLLRSIDSRSAVISKTRRSSWVTKKRISTERQYTTAKSRCQFRQSGDRRQLDCQ